MKKQDNGLGLAARFLGEGKNSPLDLGLAFLFLGEGKNSPLDLGLAFLFLGEGKNSPLNLGLAFLFLGEGKNSPLDLGLAFLFLGEGKNSPLDLDSLPGFWASEKTVHWTWTRCPVFGRVKKQSTGLFFYAILSYRNTRGGIYDKITCP
ncbi:hypothetical protein BVE84_04570 [Streptococcus azizii]|uniref:Uncharacterized protein n=1 Tax=Streptococcus azizii TaxID=1579424 RepID=A0AB36JRM2_9STRE|nr:MULTISPECIES: hypothetical protein [Streptococcus]ONK25578.1 hypothetical protein BVE85_09875 [Streptococcus azizii]ONK27619.1 hypothetical protein BVE86_04410 [Streptococcus azizii]ONK29799.1 hypothetical protein BVE84_04570 [Streptococcus azizii]